MEKMSEMLGRSDWVQYREICVFSQVRSFWWKPELGHGAGRCDKTGQGMDVGTKLDMEKRCE